MKRFLIPMALIVLAACNQVEDNFHIYGTVEKPELEGACIYLVPMMEKVIEPTKENLDSTFIKDGKFEFHGNIERMSDLRIEKYRRRQVQNLLVVTEPGIINVTIGQPSSGGGTPQNDSLQVWKDLSSQMLKDMHYAENGAQKDSIRSAFSQRTKQLAHNCGDSTTIAKFLLHLK